MKTGRIPWHLLIGLALGVGLGLVISWTILPPAESTETTPASLRIDFKDKYRALIASAYASTGDIDQAKERLIALNDENPVVALESQAQRNLAEGKNMESLDSLALFAANLAQERAVATSTPLTTQKARETEVAQREDDATPEPEMPTLTPIPVYTLTQVPTRVASPTPSTSYIIQTQDDLCSTNISEGLLMIYVSDASQKAVPGVEVIVSWDGNEEHFFTGLKPELGDGYADFSMDPSRSYSARLVNGGAGTFNLSAPPCQDDEGNHYWGSIRLRFQEP